MKKPFCKIVLLILSVTFAVLSCSKEEVEINELTVKKNTQTAARTPESDREALVTIFLANPGNTLGWNLTTPISTWQGVAVNENGRVTQLDLGFRNISVLPEALGNLTELEYLRPRGNNLTALPESISNLTQLRYLYCANNNLIALPESIGNLTNLLRADFRDNNLTELPESIGNLENLFWISLRSNNLETLPASMANLTELTNLSVRENNLTHIPVEITYLSNLISLNISNNPDLIIPQEICSLDYVNSGNTICATPDHWALACIYYANPLSRLAIDWDITNPNISEWGARINLNSSGRVVSLNMNNSSIRVLPPEIRYLTELGALRIGRNPITFLPPEIGQLTRLTILDVSQSITLRVIPEEIGNLINLRTLNISEGAVETLPNSICNLSNLFNLNVALNRLDSLPECLINLENLFYFSAFFNDFSSLSPELCEFIDALDFASLSYPKLTEGVCQ